MKFLYPKLSLVLLTVCFLCCNSAYDINQLIGSWKVAEWTQVGSGKAISQRMDFTFDKDKAYFIDYGSEKEEGTFYLAGEYLHTKEHGGIEKSVLIKRLTPDSLILNMNRAGSLEEIILVKDSLLQ